MKLKRAALLLFCVELTILTSGNATLQKLNKVQRHLDTFMKPPPAQQFRPVQPQQPYYQLPQANEQTNVPLMQRIARWFLSSDASTGETYYRPNVAQTPVKQEYGITKAIIPQKAAPATPRPEPCRPCNKIPWVPMFPGKQAISNAVLSLVSGQAFGGGGGNPSQVSRPKDPPVKPYPSGPTGSEYIPVPAAAPQLKTTRRPTNIMTGLIPRPVGRPPPPPPPPPPPSYRVPPPYSGIGDQRHVYSYLSPPYIRPPIYGQMRPIGQVPQKDPITITIHEDKNRPNAVYSIPGGPQIQFMSDFRPSPYGASAPPAPPAAPQQSNKPEIIPSIPLVDFLSSVEYPMQLGNTYMMDLTKDDPNKQRPVGVNFSGGSPSLNGPSSENPLYYSTPTKRAPFIGPSPSTEHPLNKTTAIFHTTQRPLISSGFPPAYSTTHSPLSSISGHSDSPTVSSIFSTTPGPTSSYHPSTESPKFSIHYNPSTSTSVDIQPSLQTSEHLSSAHSIGQNNNAIHIHPGKGFSLPQNQGNVKGHFITEQPSLPSPVTNGHSNGNKYPQRPPPSPFQPPRQGNSYAPASLAPNPALWTKNHPYSYEVPPAMNNYDSISTGSGKANVPINHNPSYVRIEAPPEFHFVHDNKGGSNNRQTPKPFGVSSTPLPPPSAEGGDFLSPANEDDKKAKRTKQIQIIIPYITGSDPSKEVDTALPSNLEHTILLPNKDHSETKSTKDYSEINKPNSSPSSENSLSKWQQQYPVDDDYHVHQESRTVSASAPHPNQLFKGKGSEMKLEIHKDTGVQHVLASNIRELLNEEVDNTASENPLFRLQKNIDTWTAQQYSGQPTTATTTGYVNSKSTTNSFLNLFDDHEASGTNDHSATVRPDRKSTTPIPRSTEKSTSSTFWGIQTNFVIPEATKMENSTERVQNQVESTTNQANLTTAANWSQTKVDISPITKEKVYVVTPMAVGSWVESATTTTTPRPQTTTTAPRPVFRQPTTTVASKPADVSVSFPGTLFHGKSPRFLVRPTPGLKSEGWPSNGVFVSTSTDASVRENAEDISSNDIFFATERPRHKASEGTFAIYGPSGQPGSSVTIPAPSYTLLPGTQVKTYTGHSRVVTSVSSPTFSFTNAYSEPTPRALPRFDEFSGVSPVNSGRRVDDDVSTLTSDSAFSPSRDSSVETSTGDGADRKEDLISQILEFSFQQGSLAAEEKDTLKGVVIEHKR